MGLQETSIIFQNIRFRHYYLCRYLPLASGIDTVSRSLMKFKRSAQPHLDSWRNRTLHALLLNPLPLPADTVIIRALHHGETRAAADHPSPLDILGNTLAAFLGFPYLPGFLQKSRPTSPSQILTRPERQAELEGIYQINPAILPQSKTPSNPKLPPPQTAPNPNCPQPKTDPTPNSILILDDILTTGATIRAILHPLHTTYPTAAISILTLGKVA